MMREAKPVLQAASQAMIDEFCDTLWLEDGLAKNSLDAYRRDMVLFATWLQAERGTMDLLFTLYRRGVSLVQLSW